VLSHHVGCSTSPPGINNASKTFSLGLIVRKPLVGILEKMGVVFKELDTGEAIAALDRIGESKGITVSTGQLVKGLALAFFLPTGGFLATLKKFTIVQELKPQTV